MPVHILGDDLPLTLSQIDLLWRLVCSYLKQPEDQANVRSVSEDEIRTLNKVYRHQDSPTNVLTFSYGAINIPDGAQEHDIAVCLPIAKIEVGAYNVALADYVALLLTHAFLHAKGMDHELSPDEARATKEAEKDILTQAGFKPLALES